MLVGHIGIDENNNVICGLGSPKTTRGGKGKSLIALPSDYTVIDLETTGLDPYWNEIIEIAALRVRGGVVADSFHTLVDPKQKIDEFITSLTGITNDMLRGAPTIKKALPKFIEYIGGDIIVAHNASFDINFIYDNCKEYMDTDFGNGFIDTMRISRRIFTGFPSHTLQEIAKQLQIAECIEHRALSDAEVTNKCYCYIKKYVSDNAIDINALYPKRQKSHLHAKDITAQGTEFDEFSPIFGKQFVFTGTLEKMIRKEAMQCVVNMGGTCGDGVTAATNYLVMGNTDYSKVKDGKSAKQKKAEKMILQGADIQVISENVFYDMLEE